MYGLMYLWSYVHDHLYKYGTYLYASGAFIRPTGLTPSLGNLPTFMRTLDWTNNGLTRPLNTASVEIASLSNVHCRTYNSAS